MQGRDELSLDDGTPGPRRRRFGAGTVVLALLVGAGGGVGTVALTSRHPDHDHDHAPEKTGAAQAEKKTRYTCPMHPTIVQDHPGDCPICGMKLVPLQATADPGAEAAKQPASKGERKIAFYRSPMDPKQTSPTPRKDEMGMDYLPVYQDETGAGAAPVDGLATVNIDPMRQQLIGLQSVAVTQGEVGTTLRTVGRVQVDPTAVRRINVKVEGFVERIWIDFVGQPVKRGQALFSLYSPELVSAQSEYLLARKTRARLAAGSGSGSAQEDGESLVSAARQKLRLWDVPQAEVDRLERTGEVSRTVTFVSPISGVVTAKNVVEGARIGPSEIPYEVTDLGHVWVMADAYESDLGRVHVGMSARLTLTSYPNQLFTGRVDFIDPVLDPKTRTVKVHLHFANAEGKLKPEMFGEVTLQGRPRQGLIIPADAVIQTGTRQVVFVDLGEGKLQPREVQLGVHSGDTVEVRSGLAQGEKVVTRANFLIDSESRLRASLAAMGGK
jgi:Cu(I)/Ag(I) efflux system membrane fusion protein